MHIRTFAAAAVLGLALGAPAAWAVNDFPSPSTEGFGRDRTIFPDNQAGPVNPLEQSHSAGQSGSGAQLGGAQVMPPDTSRLGTTGMAPLDQSAGLSARQLSQNESFVRQVQQKLNAAGYDVGTVDGRWGPRSQQALRSYQRDNGMQPNGTLSSEVASSLQIQAPNEPQAAQMPSSEDERR